jgi:hypothetical protein
MRPLPRKELPCASAPGGPPLKSRSARVVSHHFGGFLRIVGRGLVASRSRSWGSRRFHLVRRRPEVGGARTFPSRRTYPSKESPSDSRTASPRPLPPCSWYLRAFHARITPLPEWRLRGRWAQDLDFEALLRRRVPARTASLPMRTRPVLPGLLSPSRSFAAAGDPVSHRHLAGAPREERVDRKLRSPPVDARGRGQERAGRDARRTARQGASRQDCWPTPGAGRPPRPKAKWKAPHSAPTTAETAERTSNRDASAEARARDPTR